MIKVTDQYFWNFVFLLFFGALVVLGTIILETEVRVPFSELGLIDGVLIALASWRLTRFLNYDTTTKFLREQLYDLKKTARSYTLEKPDSGPRRALIEIINSHYSLGLGMTALVSFIYLVTPYALYPVLFLALSGVVTIIDLLVSRHERQREEL